MEERIERLEKIGETKEREGRRKNIVVKGLREEGERIEKEIREVLKGIGAEVSVRGMRILEVGKKDWRGMAVAELGSAEERKRMMDNKRKLKGGKVWIEQDLTWRERKARWKLRQIAAKEKARGNRVWAGRGKLRIEGKWWIWDEEREELRDERGRIWEEKGVTGKGRREGAGK